MNKAFAYNILVELDDFYAFFLIVGFHEYIIPEKI